MISKKEITIAKMMAWLCSWFGSAYVDEFPFPIFCINLLESKRRKNMMK
jgi:hypothetical protein